MEGPHSVRQQRLPRSRSTSFEFRALHRFECNRRMWLRHSVQSLLAASLVGPACVWASDEQETAEGKTLKNFPLYKQPDKISCGPTCCSMVLSYYGICAGFRTLQKQTKSRLLKIGAIQVGFTFPSKVEKALEAFGVGATVYQAGCSEHIQQMIDQSRPPILLVRSSRKTWHYVVAIGYDKSHSILVSDPAGHQYWLSWDVLDRAWRFDGDLRGNSYQKRRRGFCRVGRRIDVWRTLVETNLIEEVHGQMMIAPDQPAVS